MVGQIDSLVEAIRSNTSDRLIHVTRVVVYGLLVVVMAVMALVLFVVGAIRALDRLLPGEVWLPYLILGAIFLAAGLFLWSKRTASPTGP